MIVQRSSNIDLDSNLLINNLRKRKEVTLQTDRRWVVSFI
jgi:hypothetical protein